jgi:DNA-binding transcriptional LysR family regulator
LDDPEDLEQVPVIADQSSMLSWPEWLAGAGVRPDLALAGPSYSDPSLAFDAAMAGQGVLLAVDLMAADAVELGRLVQPFAYRHDTGLGYWFSTDSRRHRPKRVHEFLAFLRTEIACSEAALDGLPKPEALPPAPRT